ncbi:MAG: hypothetical protein E7270_07775 [Lachnospiraceae bacterium]|nr:hypothetical protein [Lachnospiraceae bacterium]
MGMIQFIQSIITIIKNGIDVGYFLSTHHSFRNKNITHYFENYHKHVTIYNDGTGVVINEFDMVFNKKEKTFLRRGIDISDGKKDACFPTLKEMKKVNIQNRFSEYGFWVYSEDNIISSVKEKYWTEIDDGFENEDIVLKNDNKVLRWVFEFNYSRIKPNKKYKVVYVMSIPCMYPINNGKLCVDSINDERLLNDLEQGNSTSIRITNPIRNFCYTLSFEDGILLEREPKCLLKLIGQENNQSHPKLKYSYNTIYRKYICSITKPKIGSIIKINWQFKEEQL